MSTTWCWCSTTAASIHSLSAAASARSASSQSCSQEMQPWCGLLPPPPRPEHAGLFGGPVAASPSAAPRRHAAIHLPRTFIVDFQRCSGWSPQRTPALAACSNLLCAAPSADACQGALPPLAATTAGLHRISVYHCNICRMIRAPTPQDRIKSVNPKVVILSGGPNSVHVEGSPRVPADFFDWAAENSIPVLGICYGMQLIVQVMAEAGLGCVLQCLLLQRLAAATTSSPLPPPTSPAHAPLPPPLRAGAPVCQPLSPHLTTP